MKASSAKLRDSLPPEFFVEHLNSKAVNMLDATVVAVMDGTQVAWPGSHRNVCLWWKLDNGYAVGWNENPGRGWSFPVRKLK